MNPNNIKITKQDGSYVSFENLTDRQLEILMKFQEILDLGRNKKLSDKDVGLSVKFISRDQV